MVVLVAILAFFSHREPGLGLSIDGVRPGMRVEDVGGRARVTSCDGRVVTVSGPALMEDGKVLSDPCQAGFSEEWGRVGCTDEGCYQQLIYRRGLVSIPAMCHGGVTTYTLGGAFR